jgi:phosphoglycolate phosphatase
MLTIPKAILFDFDGTLANTAPGIVLTMQKTFQEMCLPIPRDEEVRHTIGLPLKKCVQTLGQLSDKEAEEGTAIYRKLFPVYEIEHISIFPSVSETLSLLFSQGIRMAICTSRNKFSLDSILQRYALENYFETILTADTHKLNPKPAPDMALVLMERLQVNASQTLVVGDTTFDIEMGNRAHCTTVAVTYGNHSRQQLLSANPTQIIDHFDQIVEIV